jgi:hypothetical protein
MNYEIINKSWSKRRQLDPQKAITTIEFVDFKKQHNHFCRMLVNYADGSADNLLSRVIFNDIKHHWTIDGMKVAVRLIGEVN